MKIEFTRTILWGATGQAKVLQECLSHQKVVVAALFDNNPALVSPLRDVPLYYGMTGLTQWLTEVGHVKGAYGCLVAIGGDRGKDRLALQLQLAECGLTPLLAVHPTAFVAQNAMLGAGSQILAQAAVSVEARLGRACIVNTGATVDHECRLGDGVHICPGAHLAGCVQVGDFAMIGTGAVVLPRIEIGSGAMIGAGAVVTRNVPSHTIMVGNPARELRKKHD